MEIEFAYREEASGLFGKIKRPVAKITLLNKNKKVPQIFYVDSGADITLIPRSIGQVLDLDNPSPSEIVEIKGIGERGVPIVIRTVTAQFETFSAKIRLGWSLIEEVPLLLGREDFFKFFDIIFSKNSRTIFKFSV